MKKACYFIVIISLFISNISFSQNFWKPTGQIEGGRVVAVAVAPNGSIFAGGERGGIFRSTDNGATWEQTNNGLEDLGIKTIQCDNDGRIIVGTDYNIYMSANNGNDWQLSDIGYCADISIDASGIIYAARGGNPQVSRSTDHGSSWEPINNGIDTTNITLVQYTNNDILIAVDYSKGIFKSTDNGASWSPSDTGYLIGDAPSSINSDNNGKIFLSTYFAGLYESTDDGSSWSKINGDIADTYILDVSVNSSGDIFSATFTDLYESVNNGTNWTQLNTGTNSRSLQCVTTDNSDNIVVGTYYDGVVRSTDGGSVWETLNNGMYFTTTKSLVADSSGNLYAVVIGKGIYKSTYEGNSWSLMNIKDDQYNLSIEDIQALPSGGLIAHAVVGGTYVTTNYTLWTPFTNPFTSNYSFLTVAVSKNGYYFGGTPSGKIYRTPSSTANWIDITDTLSTSYIYKIGVDPDGNVFVISDIGVYRSTNNGDTWQTVNGIPATYNFSIAFSPNGDIFIGGGGEGGGVYRSTDGGLNWTNHTEGLTNTGILSLVVNPDGNIYAGTFQGVFKSNDSGATWNYIGEGLVSGKINSLLFTPSNYLLAGTEGSGIFKSINPFVTGVRDNKNLPAMFSLKQNYPNPFNPSTKITYILPMNEKVILKVYNILGKEVAELLNKNETAGEHSVQFDGNNLSSGVYFYSITAGNFHETKKMVLLK
jgi:photosystem II stability/assembly factor-like uncharacterized protein